MDSCAAHDPDPNRHSSASITREGTLLVDEATSRGAPDQNSLDLVLDTGLVNRDIALSETVPVETSADHRRVTADSCLLEARGYLAKALAFWKLLHDKNSQNLRHACFRAYHLGLAAAATILAMPFVRLRADRCDNLTNHITIAGRLLHERRVKVDIEPYLLELREGAPKDDGELLLNLDAFLDEVAALLRSCSVGERRLEKPAPRSSISQPVSVVLPELPSGPATVVLVGPVGIDEAMAAWGDVEPGGECVLDWLKHEGDTVTVGEPVAELRGDGWTEALPSPVNGTLVEIQTNRGQVQLGSVLAVIDSQ